jgi:hypothetical protein
MPFFDPSFQAALRKGITLTKMVTEKLGECKGAQETSTELGRLWKTAKDLSNFQSSDTRTIAVLGDSGEGIFTMFG